jgi:hypothetical protein
MTGPQRRRAAARPAPAGWQACIPELMIAAVLVLVTGAAAYGYGGLRAAVLTLLGWALLALVLLRALLPPTARTLVQHLPWQERSRTSFIGFWRKRATLTDAIASMASYDHELRLTLQHLLAARLAERHDISLYHDPVAARRILLPGGRGDELWYWLDPDRPAESEQQRRGIPPRTLAAIIDRLERL